MDGGCVFLGKKVMVGNDVMNICLAKNTTVNCDGSSYFKSQCPEWGPTREAEKYYEKMFYYRDS